MLIDLSREPAAAGAETSDICIVGAGAAGLTLARRLAQRGRSRCPQWLARTPPSLRRLALGPRGG